MNSHILLIIGRRDFFGKKRFTFMTSSSVMGMAAALTWMKLFSA